MHSLGLENASLSLKHNKASSCQWHSTYSAVHTSINQSPIGPHQVAHFW